MNYTEEIAKIVRHYSGKDITGMRNGEWEKIVWKVLTDLIEENNELKSEDVSCMDFGKLLDNLIKDEEDESN